MIHWRVKIQFNSIFGITLLYCRSVFGERAWDIWSSEVQYVVTPGSSRSDSGSTSGILPNIGHKNLNLERRTSVKCWQWNRRRMSNCTKTIFYFLFFFLTNIIESQLYSTSQRPRYNLGSHLRGYKIKYSTVATYSTVFSQWTPHLGTSAESLTKLL